MIVCPRCGAQNRDTVHFCNSCAAPLQSFYNTCPWCETQNLAQARYCHQCAALSQAGISPATGTLPPRPLLAGRYLILEEVGQGGMGTVYKTADARISTKLWAIKELSDAAMTNPEDKLLGQPGSWRNALANGDVGRIIPFPILSEREEG